MYINKEKKTFKLLLLTACLLLQFRAEAQQWEDITFRFGSWQIANDLNVYSNSLTQLRVENLNAVSKDNAKNNKIDYRTIVMNLNMKENNPFEIAFELSNSNNNPYGYKYKVYEKDKKGKFKKKGKWYNGNIYYGIYIELIGVDGSVITHKVWTCAKKENYSTAFSINRNDGGWTNSYYLSGNLGNIGKISIKKDVNNDCYISDVSEATYKHIAGIKSIHVMIGSAAKVSVNNFTVKRQNISTKTTTTTATTTTTTTTASSANTSNQIKTFIDRGDKYMQQEQYANAVSEYTNAINQGYKNADIYIRRARANALREFDRNAIEDCTTALSYNNSSKDAYFIRGFCKLRINDETGVADLRKGGDAGIQLLKEIGLYDYYPSNNSTRNNAQQQRQVSPQQSGLRKDPNFKIE